MSKSVLSKMSTIVSASSTGVGFLCAMGEVRRSASISWSIRRSFSASAAPERPGRSSSSPAMRRILPSTALRRASVGCAVKTGRNSRRCSSAMARPAAALVNQLAVGDGDVVDRVLALGDVHRALARAERPHAVVLLADVGKVEVGHEGAHDQRRRARVQVAHDVLELGEGSALVRGLRGLVSVGAHRVGEKNVEGGAELGVELLEHLAHQAQEQRHVLGDAAGNVKDGNNSGIA